VPGRRSFLPGVLVLTHHARDPARMAGGTTSQFLAGGIETAPDRERAAAGARAVRLGGGDARIREPRSVAHVRLRKA
jgi:hypothetical protein